jgi:hypothetical protein
VSNIEFAENFKMLLDSWNMKANVWLRESIYKRVTKKGAKPGFKSSLMTFTVSAIWVSSFLSYSDCALTLGSSTVSLQVTILRSFMVFS